MGCPKILLRKTVGKTAVKKIRVKTVVIPAVTVHLKEIEEIYAAIFSNL